MFRCEHFLIPKLAPGQIMLKVAVGCQYQLCARRDEAATVRREPYRYAHSRRQRTVRAGGHPSWPSQIQGQQSHVRDAGRDQGGRGGRGRSFRHVVGGRGGQGAAAARRWFVLPESRRRRGQTSREQRNGGRTANAQCVQCRWHNRSDVPTGEIGFIPGVGGMLDLWCLDPERRPRPRKKGANARATSNQCATPASPTASLRRGATRPCRPARAGSRCD
jgi:hypothetical protein